MSRIGIVGDLHEPFTHPMYSRFIQDTFALWGVTKVHFIGDIVDCHALGFWEHDPNGMSAEDERVKASVGVAKWYKLFPEASVSIGNHDERHFRVARKAGIPDSYLKGYPIVWGTPKWQWEMSNIYDGVLYEHGTDISGKDGAFNTAMQKRMSCVIGHIHAHAGIKYHCSPTSRIFGMQVGVGVDIDAYAFAYGKNSPNRPVLSAGVIIDGQYGYIEPMLCGPGEKYHRSRA